MDPNFLRTILLDSLKDLKKGISSLEQRFVCRLFCLINPCILGAFGFYTIEAYQEQ